MQVVTLLYKGQELLWVTGSYKVLQSAGVAGGTNIYICSLDRSNKGEGVFSQPPVQQAYLQKQNREVISLLNEIPLHHDI